MSVRVRFVPRSTSSLHIGDARTAVFNWLFARGQEDSAFVVRMSDHTAGNDDQVMGDLL